MKGLQVAQDSSREKEHEITQQPIATQMLDEVLELEDHKVQLKI